LDVILKRSNLVFKHQKNQKMKKLVLSVALIVAVLGIQAQTKWNLDKVHSNVKFTVSHMVVSEVEGSFKMFEGSLVASKADLSDAVQCGCSFCEYRQ
jgi:polyisoprenoid-binding protein YceI